MDIAEFLLARIAEDEEAAQDPGHRPHLGSCEAYWSGAGFYVCTCDYPTRILAECEAKRRIVEMHSTGLHPDGFGVCNWDNYVAPCETLAVLALPYADHPDYDAEWKP